MARQFTSTLVTVKTMPALALEALQAEQARASGDGTLRTLAPGYLMTRRAARVVTRTANI